MAIAPGAPDGHFWLAANMGLLAELFGRREGLRYRTDIKHALEAALAADPAYLHGSAERALGRWYATVPGMFGGNKKTGEAHLRASLDLKRDSAITMVLLAELLLDQPAHLQHAGADLFEFRVVLGGDVVLVHGDILGLLPAYGARVVGRADAHDRGGDDGDVLTLPHNLRC